MKIIIIYIIIAGIALSCSLSPPGKKKKKSNAIPEVNIIFPTKDRIFLVGDTTTYIWHGRVTDKEDGIISGNNVEWFIGNVFLGNDTSIPVNNSKLSYGEQVVIFKALDSKNQWNSASVNIELTDSIPAVRILSPASGSIFLKDDYIYFRGEAYDTIYGNLYDSSLKWASNIDGIFGYGTTVVSSLSPGTHNIRLTASNINNITDSTSIGIIINQKPDVSIKYRNDIKKYYAKSDIIYLQAEASDPEDGLLKKDSSYVWTSSVDTDSTWIGKIVNLTNMLSLGKHIIKIIATDSLGAANYDSVSFTVKEFLEPPKVEIKSPLKDEIFIEYDTIVFEGLAEDPEDGEIADSTYSWSSNKDGNFGKGRIIKTTLDVNEPNKTAITLKVHDIDNMFGSTKIDILIKKYNEPPVSSITYPKSGRSEIQGRLVYFLGEGNDAEEGKLKDRAFFWYSDKDGLIGNHKELFLNNLIPNEHIISLIVKDKKDAYSSTGINLKITPSDWETFTNGNSINCLASDPSVLWAGTTGGLVRWNTYNTTYAKFTTFDGLIDNNVTSLIYDSTNKNLWIGTTGGLCKFYFDSSSHWETYDTSFTQLLDNKITSLALDKAGNLWIGTWAGINKLNLTAKNMETFTGYKVTSLVVNNDNELWVGTQDQGVARMNPPGTLSKYYKSSNSILQDNSIKAIAVDLSGNIWIGTEYKGVYRFNKGIDQFDLSFDVSSGLINNSINSINIDIDGKVWVGTPTGISVYNGDILKSISTKGQLFRDKNVTSIAFNEQYVFPGTGIGINRFAKATIDDEYGQLLEIKNDKLKYNNISTLAKDNSGYIWLGFDGNGGGVDSFKGTDWNNYTYYKYDSFYFNYVYNIFISEQNNVWLGTEGGIGIFSSTNKSYSDAGTPNITTSITSITEDAFGAIWAGTDDGRLYRYITTWEEFTGLWIREDQDEITSLSFDTVGKLWIGSFSRGLASYDTTGGYLHGVAQYNTGKGNISDDSVNSILVDNGKIWIGTDKGIDKFENNTWQHINAVQDFKVNSLKKDTLNNIWIGTNNGVIKYDPVGNSISSTFNPGNGLVDLKVNELFIDSSNYKWFGTDAGLSLYKGQ
ncbi:MAG: hypothetical protein HY934_04735 [Candidatus Firestonebacteria bacterium]|nr:hypothetical protein [Candidatus Firestonebacteria bacterium]